MTTEETKEKIIKSAIELFTNDGCKRVTMDNIATELHISKRTLYEYFENKEELLTACLRIIFEKMDAGHQRIFQEVDEPLLMMLTMLHNRVAHNHTYDTLVMDAKRYYPHLSIQFEEKARLSFNKTITNSLLWAQANGVLRENVNIEAVVNVLDSFMSVVRKPASHTTELWIHSADEIAYSFVRGLLTTSAIARYDAEEANLYQLITRNDDSENNIE